MMLRTMMLSMILLIIIAATIYMALLLQGNGLIGPLSVQLVRESQ